MKQKTVKHILFSPLYITPILVGVFYNWVAFIFLITSFFLSLVVYWHEWDEVGERVCRWYNGFEK